MVFINYRSSNAACMETDVFFIPLLFRSMRTKVQLVPTLLSYHQDSILEFLPLRTSRRKHNREFKQTLIGK